MNYKGQLVGFPPEVVEKMLDRQSEQGNDRDANVFECNLASGREKGGFTWKETIERHEFWGNVIYDRNFDLFFERYPKITNAEDMPVKKLLDLLVEYENKNQNLGKKDYVNIQVYIDGSGRINQDGSSKNVDFDNIEELIKLLKQ
jgi:hypothetical protein